MIKYHTSDNMAENKEVEMLKEKLFDKKENGWKSVKTQMKFLTMQILIWIL